MFRNFALQNFPFLENDFDAMTDYELFCKMVEYMKKSLEKVDGFQLQINKFSEDLKYFENYFENLDVTEEVNNKLDEMVEDGTMEELIAQYLQLNGLLVYKTVAEMKAAENLSDGMIVETVGYYAYNDGGGSKYKIRNLSLSDTVDDMFIISLSDESLVAELIYKDIDLKVLGAKGDGTSDDTNILKGEKSYETRKKR